MITVDWIPWNSRCNAEEDQTLLEIALEWDLPLPHSCGGDGVCSTCAVEILAGGEYVSAEEELETETLNKLLPHRTPVTRLACQTRIKGGKKGLIQIKSLLPSQTDSV